jgi:hypothetical protein
VMLTANGGGFGGGAICGCGWNGNFNGASGNPGGTSINTNYVPQSGIMIMETGSNGGAQAIIRY